MVCWYSLSNKSGTRTNTTFIIFIWQSLNIQYWCISNPNWNGNLILATTSQWQAVLRLSPRQSRTTSDHVYSSHDDYPTSHWILFPHMIQAAAGRLRTCLLTRISGVDIPGPGSNKPSWVFGTAYHVDKIRGSVYTLIHEKKMATFHGRHCGHIAEKFLDFE